MGCSIAFHLAAAGMRDVVVVEGDHVCAGNTRKSGALVRMHYDNEPDARLAFFSLRYFQRWRDVVGYESGFTNTGAAVVVGPENAVRLRKNVAMLQLLGITTHEITPAELKARQPFIVTDDLGAVAYEPDSGYADPVLTTQSFARRAVELGATICEGVRVEALRVEHGRVIGLRTTAGDIDADHVVLAAGPWTVGLLRETGVELDVRPVRAEIAFVQRPPELAEGHFVYLDHKSGSYFRPTRDGLSLLGTGTARRPLAEDQMDSYDESSTERIVEVIRTRIRERAPSLADAPIARGHAGLYDMSPDEKAILDQVPGIDGAYMAVGFSGTGFKQSPAVGVAMSELVMNGVSSTVDICAFSFDRFSRGRLLRGEHEYVSKWPMH
jgi:sarcosine oxidase, subunit beta